MTTTFETAKVGDKVWSLVHGWGVISRIESYSDYPIKVNFEKSFDSFTFDGKLYASNKHQSIFLDEVKIIAPEKPKAAPPPVDTKVIVCRAGRSRFKRYSAGQFDDNGRLMCYENGATSFSDNGHLTAWENWELAE